MASRNVDDHPYSMNHFIHHHHHDQQNFLLNLTFQKGDFITSIFSTNESNVATKSENYLLPVLPLLNLVLFQAILAQLVLGLIANSLILVSVIASMRAQSSHAYRRSLYSSVTTSYSARLSHAQRKTPVVDQIVALLAFIALLRLCTRTGIQVLCYYVDWCTFLIPLPCSSLHGFLNTFLHTLHLWTVALFLQDRYIAHQDPSSYLSKCSHTVFYVTLVGITFLATMHFLAPIYGFSAYRFVTEEHTCTIDWLSHYSCPYWIYSVAFLWGPVLLTIICRTLTLTYQKTVILLSIFHSYCSSARFTFCCCPTFSTPTFSSPTSSSVPPDYHFSPPLPVPPVEPNKYHQTVEISSSQSQLPLHSSSSTTTTFFRRRENSSQFLECKSHFLHSCCRFHSSSNYISKTDVQQVQSNLNNIEMIDITTRESLNSNSSSNSAHKTEKRQTKQGIFFKKSSSLKSCSKYSAAERGASSSSDAARAETNSLSPSLLQQFRSGNAGVSSSYNSYNNNYRFDHYSSINSQYSRSNVLTSSRELASVTVYCWLYLLAYLPKLFDSGCRACFQASPYPVITDEQPNPPTIFATPILENTQHFNSEYGKLFEKRFLLSYFDEGTSCLLLPLLLLAFHSRLRFSGILIIASFLNGCNSLSKCRLLSCRLRSRQHRKFWWYFGSGTEVGNGRRTSVSTRSSSRSSSSFSRRLSRSNVATANSLTASRSHSSKHSHDLPTLALSPPQLSFKHSDLERMTTVSTKEQQLKGSSCRTAAGSSRSSFLQTAKQKSVAVTVM